MRTNRRKSEESQVKLRPLSKHELDRRMEHVVAELGLGWLGKEAPRSRGRKVKPRRIAPADLVRRMRKFMVYN